MSHCQRSRRLVTSITVAPAKRVQIGSMSSRIHSYSSLGGPESREYRFELSQEVVPEAPPKPLVSIYAEETEVRNHPDEVWS